MLNNKVNATFLIVVAVIIIISSNLRSGVAYCIQAPCPQSTTYLFGKIIYSFLTFNGIFSNNTLSLQIKNMMQPNLSAGTVYFLIDIVASLSVYFIALTIIGAMVSKSKTSRK